MTGTALDHVCMLVGHYVPGARVVALGASALVDSVVLGRLSLVARFAVGEAKVVKRGVLPVGRAGVAARTGVSLEGSGGIPTEGVHTAVRKLRHQPPVLGRAHIVVCRRLVLVTRLALDHIHMLELERRPIVGHVTLIAITRKVVGVVVVEGDLVAIATARGCVGILALFVAGLAVQLGVLAG